MIVGGDSSELVKNDEIWVISADEGDKEINLKENIWLGFGVQMRSYCKKLSIWRNVIQGEG